ncbi:MAG: hypothetical protein IJ660_06805 [Alphaproteobacteria bacterium]|nr:hypothetical protein [Alphaproteobacteria bacterium]
MQKQGLLNYFKQTVKRSYSEIKFVNPRSLLMWYIFVFIVCLTLLFGVILPFYRGEEFSISTAVPIFIIFFAVMAFLIFRSIKKCFARNMPFQIDQVLNTYGTPDFISKCWICAIGGFVFRGFHAKLYFYKKALIVKFRKRCLIIDNPSQISFYKLFMITTVEFTNSDKYVKCYLNNGQLHTLINWINGYD